MTPSRASLAMVIAAVAFTIVPNTATGQSTIVIPNGMATAEGNSSNAFPWGRGGTGLRIQTVYDTSHFTTQGVTYPVLITRLRWRPNSSATTTWVNTSYQTATVRVSSCPVDQAAVSTASFAANTGPDVQMVFNGPISWAAGSAPLPGPAAFLIDVPFSSPFLYNPTLGADLNIDTDLPVQTFVGTTLQLDVTTSAPLASRTYMSTGYPTGTLSTTLNHGVVVEVTYVPAAGIHANFSATPSSGHAPLAVQFNDQTFTDAPGGVTSWAWDFDNDSVIDSTAQNPSYTYLVPGQYTVTLTATDGTNGSNTITRTNAVNVGPYVFDVQTTGGGVGDLSIYPVPNVGVPTATTGYMFLSFAPPTTVGSGPAFGIVPDGTTWSILASPASVGSVLHWIDVPGLFPNVPLIVPPGALSLLVGQTVDFVQIDLTPAQTIANISNVDRITF